MNNVEKLDRHSLNTLAVEREGIRYRWQGVHRITMAIRDDRYPWVDFFPHTGKYRILGTNEWRDGGHEPLIRYLKKHKRKKLLTISR